MTAAVVASNGAAIEREGRGVARCLTLGRRPGFEAVQQAKLAMARIDAMLSEHLRSAVLAPPPPWITNAAEWRADQERSLREGAEKEKIPHRSVIKLEELHQGYKEGKVAPAYPKVGALDGKPVEELKVSSVGADDEKTKLEAADLVLEASKMKGEMLDLSNQFLSQIPGPFAQIVTLVSLDLSGNQLQSLPGSFAGLVNLELLRVNSNMLKDLPESIGLLSKLKFLDVSSNALEQLPESIGRCSSLQEINASFNHLEFMPPNFGSMLVFLEKLELHLNKLTSIPASVCSIKSLTYLDVHMNKLRCLPAAIGNLTQLEYLDASGNFSDLESVPNSVGNLLNLTYFDLSFNQIKELPDSIGRLDKLMTLNLEGNPMVLPPRDVVYHSHDAVMEYMHQRYIYSTVGDLQVSASSKGLIFKPRKEYNPWIPVCISNSPLAQWLNNVCGTMSNMLSGGAGEFLGFDQYPSFRK